MQYFHAKLSSSQHFGTVHEPKKKNNFNEKNRLKDSGSQLNSTVSPPHLACTLLRAASMLKKKDAILSPEPAWQAHIQPSLRLCVA